MRVLVIEDNTDIAASICDYLETKGFLADAAGDGVTGLHLAVTNPYEVIILDLGLPGIDGIDLCTRLRQDAENLTPILMLTARDSLEDKLRGFHSGADDYLVKPFALEELAARVNVLGQRGPGVVGVRTYRVGDIVLNESTHSVKRGGERVELNPTCFRILAFLMRHSPNVVKKQDIEWEIWQEDPPNSDALRTHISYLRAAIDKPFTVPLLHTVRGFGYRLGESDEA